MKGQQKPGLNKLLTGYSHLGLPHFHYQDWLDITDFSISQGPTWFPKIGHQKTDHFSQYRPGPMTTLHLLPTLFKEPNTSCWIQVKVPSSWAFWPYNFEDRLGAPICQETTGLRVGYTRDSLSHAMCDLVGLNRNGSMWHHVTKTSDLL